MWRLFLIIIVLAVVLQLVSARQGHVPSGPAASVTLSDLAEHPGRYENKLVSVTGIIGNRISVLGYGGTNLVDGAGHQILVVGMTTPAAPGASVTVTGRYMTAFSIETFNAPVVVADKQY